MPMLDVYDQPMCCSTGVCGPEPDPALIQFAADLAWLAEQGVEIRRHNLAQEPQAFASCAPVQQLLGGMGEDGLDSVLPALVVEGRLVAQGRYPLRDELAQLLKLVGDGSLTAAEANGAGAATLVTPQITELVALGAAMAANCETCFKYHYAQARQLGVSDQDMLRAAEIGMQVKQIPNHAITALARRLLLGDTVQVQAGAPCCTGTKRC